MIDFQNEQFRKLIDQKIEEYPELLPLVPGEVVRSYGDLKSGMDIHKKPTNPMAAEINAHGNQVPRNKIDWNAVLVYSEICKISGYKMTYDDLALELGCSPQTIKNQFSRIKEEFK